MCALRYLGEVMHSTGFIIQEDYNANPLFDEMEHHHANCEEKHVIVNSLTVGGSKTTEEPQVQLKATQFRLMTSPDSHSTLWENSPRCKYFRPSCGWGNFVLVIFESLCRFHGGT